MDGRQFFRIVYQSFIKVRTHLNGLTLQWDFLFCIVEQRSYPHSLDIGLHTCKWGPLQYVGIEFLAFYVPITVIAFFLYTPNPCPVGFLFILTNIQLLKKSNVALLYYDGFYLFPTYLNAICNRFPIPYNRILYHNKLVNLFQYADCCFVAECIFCLSQFIVPTMRAAHFPNFIYGKGLLAVQTK